MCETSSFIFCRSLQNITHSGGEPQMCLGGNCTTMIIVLLGSVYTLLVFCYYRLLSSRPCDLEPWKRVKTNSRIPTIKAWMHTLFLFLHIARLNNLLSTNQILYSPQAWNCGLSEVWQLPFFRISKWAGKTNLLLRAHIPIWSVVFGLQPSKTGHCSTAISLYAFQGLSMEALFY